MILKCRHYNNDLSLIKEKGEKLRAVQKVESVLLRPKSNKAFLLNGQGFREILPDEIDASGENSSVEIQQNGDNKCTRVLVTNFSSRLFKHFDLKTGSEITFEGNAACHMYAYWTRLAAQKDDIEIYVTPDKSEIFVDRDSNPLF